VHDLCAGKQFEFTSLGEATLKGFDEPVTLYEVRA
jgi:class 3 adenylate cyclase